MGCARDLPPFPDSRPIVDSPVLPAVPPQAPPYLLEPPELQGPAAPSMLACRLVLLSIISRTEGLSGCSSASDSTKCSESRSWRGAPVVVHDRDCCAPSDQGGCFDGYVHSVGAECAWNWAGIASAHRTCCSPAPPPPSPSPPPPSPPPVLEALTDKVSDDISSLRDFVNVTVRVARWCYVDWPDEKEALEDTADVASALFSTFFLPVVGVLTDKAAKYSARAVDEECNKTYFNFWLVVGVLVVSFGSLAWFKDGWFCFSFFCGGLTSWGLAHGHETLALSYLYLPLCWIIFGCSRMIKNTEDFQVKLPAGTMPGATLRVTLPGRTRHVTCTVPADAKGGDTIRVTVKKESPPIVSSDKSGAELY